jgi:osmotically-inducible protein OsmY
MRRYPKWVLTLGIVAVTPGLATAAGFPFGSDADASSSAAAAPKPKTTHNQKVAEDIAMALRKAQFRGYEIEIEYKDGVATLTGKVSDPRQKLKAQQVVGAIPGVRRLDNRLAVIAAPHGPIRQASADTEAPPAPAGAPASGGNQEKAMQIGRALETAGLSGYDIEILFQNGQAVLRGSVGTPEQIAGAGRIAQSIPGVQSVNNQLHIGQMPQQAGPAAGPRDPRYAMAAAYQQAQMAQMQGRSPYYMTAQAGTPGAPLTPGVPPGVPGAAGPAPATGPGGALGVPVPATGPVPAGPVYDNPNLPEYAWPTYAQFPNYAAVTYPSQYSASAWPYIGPFYPYPQVPLNWRKVQLEWSDGHWDLKFDSRTDRWWWFLNPCNW